MMLEVVLARPRAPAGAAIAAILFAALWRHSRRRRKHRRRRRPRRRPPPAHPGDPFGEDTALTAKTIIYVKGSGTWDKAFDDHHGFIQEDQNLSR